jgi:hypothetical protein
MIEALVIVWTPLVHITPIPSFANRIRSRFHKNLC